jgi:Homeodomain-like domain
MLTARRSKTPGAGPAGSGQEIRAAVPSAVIATELRVSERSVRRWRQAWQAGGGPAGWPPAGRLRSAGWMRSNWRRWMWC